VRVFAQLDDLASVKEQLLYLAGMRLMECARASDECLELARSEVVVR